MLVLTRKNRESVVIGRTGDLGFLVEITVLGIEAGRVRLGFQGDASTPIHRREVWDRICNGHEDGHGDGRAVASSAVVDGLHASHREGGMT